MPRVNSQRLALLAPLACLCLSANMDEKDKSIAFGPMVIGRNLEMQFTLDPDNYDPNWTVFADATADDFWLRATGIGNRRMSDLEKDPSTGLATFRATLAGRYMEPGKRRNVIMGICSATYYRGIDRSKTPFFFSQIVEAHSGSDLFFIDDEGIFETQNQVYHFNERNPAISGFDYDSYDVRGLCQNRDVSGRRVPLDELSIDYDGFGMAPLENPTAELRILDYVEDFPEIAKREGAYATIPLSVSLENLGNGHFRYRFALSSSFYYSRIDYRGYSKEPSGEPSFRSSSLYLPLRQGHDDGLYRYHVVLDGAGAFGDTLVLNNRVLATRSFFGNCLESEYCVVTGDR